MRNVYLLMVLMVGIAAGAMAQGGEISGKITDENGESIPFANVSVVNDEGVPTGSGATTDFDGFYSVKPLQPGRYNIKYSYIGYAPIIQSGVVVKNDQTTYVDVSLKPQAIETDVVEVIAYKVPLIDPGETSSKQTVTAEQIKDLPTRNIQSIASTTAGVYQDDEGGGINVRGGRGDGVVYYVDGIRVSGEVNLPVSAVEQIDVVTGGVPARYGDATAGVINVTTKGAPSTFSGGVEFQSSLDRWRFDLVNFNLSGPILKDKETGSAKIGYAIFAEYQRQLDPRPSAVDMFKVKDDVFQELQDNPLVRDESGNIFTRAEFLRAEDLEVNRIKRNTVDNEARVNAKFDFQLADNMTLTLGGNATYEHFHNWIQAYSLLNYENNPLFRVWNGRGFARFTHNVSQGRNEEDRKSGAIQNFFYQVQFDYEKYTRRYEDDSHGDDYFNYGYIGEFNTMRVPVFQAPEDINGANTLIGYTDSLVYFNPSDVNERGANFTTDLYELNDAQLDDELGYFTPNIQTLGDIQATPALTNGQRAEIPYSIWFNTGRQYNGVGVDNDDDQYRGQIQASFDILRPGAEERNKHAISFGLEYEQRIQRKYAINPLELWFQARSLVNSHLNDFDTESGYYFDDVDGDGERERIDQGDPNFDPYFTDSIYYDYLPNFETQSTFDQRLRERIGAADDEWIDLDALPVESFSIDLFSADELIRSGNDRFVSEYRGYDVYGNRADARGSYFDFWTAQDAEGNFTRPIPAFRPSYAALYIEDKFTLKDLTFRLGMRIDRYDANQPVLRDKYSLYDVRTAGDVGEFGAHPGNIGEDYKVYVDDLQNPTGIIGYRSGDQWFDAEGLEVQSARALAGGAAPAPYFVNQEEIFAPTSDDRAYNQSVDFNPDASFRDFDPAINVMPRLQFSFNVTDQALFYAHYDVLTQRPQARLSGNFIASRFIFDPIDYFFFEQLPVKNNPNLQPQTTVDFQIGFKQKITNSSAFTIGAYFKEFRNQIQYRKIEFSYPTDYFTWENIDFGNTKGFEFVYDLRRTKNVRVNANYTLQFAEGTGSDDQTQQQIINNGGDNFRTVAPLDFDSRHQLNLNFDYRFGRGDDYNGPVSKKGRQILADFGINLLARARSGTPYTKQSNPTFEADAGGGGRPVTEGYINGARIGWNFRIDTRINKAFTVTVGKDKENKEPRDLSFNVYLWIQNLLGTANVRNVYRYTGQPDTDGFLESAQGQQFASSQIDPQSYRDLYNARINSPNNYTLPRRVFIGGTMNF